MFACFFSGERKNSCLTMKKKQIWHLIFLCMCMNFSMLNRFHRKEKVNDIYLFCCFIIIIDIIIIKHLEKIKKLTYLYKQNANINIERWLFINRLIDISKNQINKTKQSFIIIVIIVHLLILIQTTTITTTKKIGSFFFVQYRK